MNTGGARRSIQILAPLYFPSAVIPVQRIPEQRFPAQRRRSSLPHSSRGWLPFGFACGWLAILAFLTGCTSAEPSGPSTEPVILSTASGEPQVLALDAVDPRFQPALEALQAAVSSGDDREARAVLERLYALDPTGPALDYAHAYERILEGRAAIQSLDLALVAEYARKESGAAAARISFVASARDGRTLDAWPGPGVLRVTVLVIDPAGALTRHSETVPLETIRRFTVRPDEPEQIDLVELPIALPAGALALRAVFELELRSGAVRTRDDVVAESARGRDLPAMRWGVEGCEITVLAKDLAREDLAAAGDLARAALAIRLDRRQALSIAVRVPRSDRAAALDELARVGRDVAEPVMSALGPALRWLAADVNLGEDPAAWRAYLRERARSFEAPGPGLRLPRPKPAALAESPRGP